MASISSPSSLASFSSSHASSSKRPHVSLNPVQGREDGLAVAAVRGDGIWTYDLASLGPTTSFTVPPSTIFNTAPISFYPPSRVGTKSSGKQKADTEAEPTHGERYTAVGILEGEKVKKEEQGRVIWVWKGEEGSKTVITLDSMVQALHHIPHHRAVILCVHQNGHLTALDSALHTRPVLTSITLNEVVASKVLSTTGDKVRIAILAKNGEVVVVEIDVGGAREITGEIVKRGKICGKAEIAFGDISEDGIITAATTHRRQGLISRSIKNLTEKVDLLPSLLHTISAAPLTLPTSGRPVSLIATAEPEPTLLLVSAASGVAAVIASHSLASLAPSAQGTIVSLSLLSTHTPFVVAVGVSYKNDESTRTAIHTVEVALPAKGIGMNVLLGTQVETAKYFHTNQGGSSGSFDKFITSFKEAIASGKALKTVESYVQVHNYGPSSGMPESQAKAILSAIFGAASENGEVKADGPYAGDVVSLLLEKKWVHDDMYPGGVLATLVKLGDWTNASIAVRTIPTIPSSATLDLVKKAIHLVDSPFLDTVLHDILLSPSPAPDYRTALRSGLTVEEGTEILVVYSRWLQGHVERKGEGLAGWSDEKKAKDQGKKKGAQVVVSYEELPSLGSIITYSSALLDSHLPLFLSHPPSFDPLQSLQESLTPLLAMQESYRRLRAPVEAVLTLSRREAKKREERESRGRGGKGKNVKNETSGLPDEAVGKWRVEQFVF